MNTNTTANITDVITGRGARIRHIAVDGKVLCPRDNATTEAKNRFAKLPVCGECEAALNLLELGGYEPAEAPADVEELAELAELAEEAGETVEIHFSHRVTKFMADQLAEQLPILAAELKAARLVRNGRGFTAFTTTSRARAERLVSFLGLLLDELEKGAREKGLKGGMNFQPEAVAKGIEHITADLEAA